MPVLNHILKPHGRHTHALDSEFQMRFWRLANVESLVVTTATALVKCAR